MKISDMITQIRNEEDVPYLRTPLLDVNMRLFKTSRDYRGLVIEACAYMDEVLDTSFENYDPLRGISGANLGIPWNIIGIARKDSPSLLMINPHYLPTDGSKLITTQSNCGSLVLDTPIEVTRYDEIVVTWYDLEGTASTKIFTRRTGAFSIQHEIDHNQGILITDLNRGAN